MSNVYGQTCLNCQNYKYESHNVVFYAILVLIYCGQICICAQFKLLFHLWDSCHQSHRIWANPEMGNPEVHHLTIFILGVGFFTLYDNWARYCYWSFVWDVQWTIQVYFVNVHKVLKHTLKGFSKTDGASKHRIFVTYFHTIMWLSDHRECLCWQRRHQDRTLDQPLAIATNSCY